MNADEGRRGRKRDGDEKRESNGVGMDGRLGWGATGNPGGGGLEGGA
jgi:hypothetical protein